MIFGHKILYQKMDLVQKHFDKQIFGSKRFLIQEIRGENLFVQLWAKLDKNSPVYSIFLKLGQRLQGQMVSK